MKKFFIMLSILLPISIVAEADGGITNTPGMLMFPRAPDKVKEKKPETFVPNGPQEKRPMRK